MRKKGIVLEWLRWHIENGVAEVEKARVGGCVSRGKSLSSRMETL